MKKICICTTISVSMKAFIIPTAVYLHEKCGYDITLVCCDDGDLKRQLPPYIKFIPVEMARGIDLSALKIIKNFIRIFKENNFDMVQYSTPNAAFYASIAAKAAKVPIRLYCQWGLRYVGLSGIRRLVMKTAEKIICRCSNAVRAQSPKNMQFGIEEGLYKQNKVSVVGYGGTIGVDTSVFDINKKQAWRNEIREKYSIDKTEYVFGFTGRVTADKGCKELFSAFKTLTESGIKAKLFIVGPLDDNCKIDNDLLSFVKNSKDVVLTGKVPISEMCRYYAAMDVLVHPTYREGFGMVLQEAGSMAVPAITTKVPGASEVFENGTSAFLVNARQTEELMLAMKRAYEQRAEFAKLGENAYKRTNERYVRPIMLSNQLNDYVKLLGE